MEVVNVKTCKDGDILSRGTIHDEVSKNHRYIQMRRSLLEAFYEKLLLNKVSDNTINYIEQSWDNAIERIEYGMKK